MHLKIILIAFILFQTIIVQAIPIDSVLVETSEECDSVEVRYSDNKSFWGFSLGYFPIWDEDFESGGISTTLYSENTISKLFKLGWSFQLNLAIDGGGYMALYGYLSYPLKLGNNNLYIKGGIGLVTYTYITPVAQFKVEYLLWEFKKSAISISISETIPGIKMLFMPPVISIGILF